MLTMIPVSSSNIASVGYEPNNLYVRFNSGWTYVYYNVPYSEYRNLLSASFHGRYFAAHIKNSYSYRRIA